MDTKSYNIRVPKRWARIALIVGVTALIVAPLTAVATDAFSDVPNSHTHHGDITWLKDAEVTKGCNPPANTQYCPDDNVTRAQMATFMRNLAENQVVDAATAVTAESAATADDADTLDGLNSTDVQTLVWSQTLDNDSNKFPGTSANVEVNSVDINAPVSGFIVISGTVYFNNNSAGTTETDLEAKLDGSAIPAGTDQATTRLEADVAGHDDANLSYTVTIPVSAGAHTVSQEVDPGTDNWFYNGAYLTVVFHPASTVNHDRITSVSSAETGDPGVDGADS